MSSKQIVEQISVNEGNDYAFNHVFNEDTTGSTLTAKIRDKDASSGTGTSVDTQSGVEAGTEVTFDLSLNGESPGEYDFEIINDSNEVLYPEPNQTVRIVIRDRFSI